MGTLSPRRGLLFLVALLALCHCASADEPKKATADEPKKTATPVFKRYVGIVYKGNKDQVVLQNVELKVLGDRLFLVGNPVGFNLAFNPVLGEARKENRRWIALCEVVDFYEFDDEKGFNKHFPDIER